MGKKDVGKPLFLFVKIREVFTSFFFYVIFTSPFFAAVTDAEFAEYAPELGDFVDGQPVFRLFL